MDARNTRWTWLSLFACANLVCWLGAAAVIGLAVGDRVDLGVETLLREGQATALVFWRQAAQRGLQPTPLATTAGQVPPVARSEAPQDRPPAAITGPAPLNPLPTRQVASGQASIQPPRTTSVFASATPAPQPEAMLSRDPLLLSNPQISSLADLDAEMSRSVTGRAVQIRYQEEALNREIATLWENNPELPFRNVHVDLRQDKVQVAGRTTVLGFEVNATVEGTVLAQDCLPQLHISAASLSGVMTPGFVQDQVEGMILEAMAWYPADYPLCLEQIVLEETRATIYGYRR